MPALLGIDFGRARTGVALAEWVSPELAGRLFTFPPAASPRTPLTWRLPTEVGGIRYVPLITLTTPHRPALVEALCEIIRAWQPLAVVIGELPARDDNRPRQITLMARKLARQLHAASALPTTLMDETLTSVTADVGTAITGAIPLDQAAAIELLRGFLTRAQPADTAMVGTAESIIRGKFN